MEGTPQHIVFKEHQLVAFGRTQSQPAPQTTLSNPPNLCVPHFPHLSNRNDKTPAAGDLKKIKEF